MRRLFIQFYLLLIGCFTLAILLIGLVYQVSAERAGDRYLERMMQGSLGLLTGELARLPPEHWATRTGEQSRQLNLPLPGLSQLSLPLIGRVAAGSPILAQEHVDQTYQVESSLFQRTPDYLLRVRGMSMRDVGIMDGDLLAVQSTREAKNGQIVVARLGEDVTVKRFMKQAGHIELRAENPDYPTIVVEPGEPFEIEGLAVGLIRNSFQI